MVRRDNHFRRTDTMKTNIRNRLLCFVMATAMAVCAMTACGESTDNTSSDEWTPHRFGVEDTEANGVRLGMTADEVKKTLGKLDKEAIYTEDQFIYGEHLDLTYGQMILSFYDINEGNDFSLGSISSQSPDVIFAGGLHAGSTRDEVLTTFYRDENAPDLVFYGEKYGSFLYGDITNNDFLERKPTGAIETAYIQDRDAEADGYYMIIYEYYDPLRWSDDQTGFTGDCYHIIFYLDTASDKVSSILLEHMQAM